MSRSAALCLFCFLLPPAMGAAAHHAVSMVYQPERTVSVSGTVEQFRFQNPHCVVFLRRTDDEGVDERWIVEWEGSSALRRRGVNADSLKAGDAVTLKGFPARDGSTQMALHTVEFADGRPSINPPDRSGANE